MRTFGVHLHFRNSITAIKGENGKRVDGVVTSDGTRLPADMVLIGIGLMPSDELARAAEIEAPNGIKVDDRLATSDANIFAIGDTVYHYNPHRGAEMRLESGQNATDQARTLAKILVGKPARYDHVPWFWSDQGDLKLQIAGFLDTSDRLVLERILRKSGLFALRLQERCSDQPVSVQQRRATICWRADCSANMFR